MEKCTPAGNIQIHKHVFFIMTYFDKSRSENMWLFQCLAICHSSEVPKIRTVAASPASCVHYQLDCEHCWWHELLEPVPTGGWLDRGHNPSCSCFVWFYRINQFFPVSCLGYDVITSVEKGESGDQLRKRTQGSYVQVCWVGIHKLRSPLLCLSSFQLCIRQRG